MWDATDTDTHTGQHKHTHETQQMCCERVQHIMQFLVQIKRPIQYSARLCIWTNESAQDCMEWNRRLRHAAWSCDAKVVAFQSKHKNSGCRSNETDRRNSPYSCACGTRREEKSETLMCGPLSSMTTSRGNGTERPEARHESPHSCSHVRSMRPPMAQAVPTQLRNSRYNIAGEGWHPTALAQKIST